MGKVVLMNAPRLHASESKVTAGVDAWLERAVHCLPLPTAVLTRDSGEVLLCNEPARSLPLEAPSAAGIVVRDAAGSTLRDGELLPYLLAHAGGPDGATFAWHTAEQTRAFRALLCPVPPLDGEQPLAVLTLVDITPQRQVETALQEAIETRDEFFSVATHELKDPLFSLQLSIQLLRHQAEKQGAVPAYVQHHLDVSRRQIDRLTRLVENLLDVSRIANRRLQLDAEALDLAELAREVTGRFQDKARALATPLTVEATEAVIGYFDRLKVEQVLTNLISNALKYGAGRPVIVRVRGSLETATVMVEDHGIGIAPQDHDRVFDRFVRAAAVHKRDSLGLGLFIVRSLVEAHGGTVGLASAVGAGSTFTVSLPRRRLHVQDDPDTPAIT